MPLEFTDEQIRAALPVGDTFFENMVTHFMTVYRPDVPAAIHYQDEAHLRQLLRNAFARARGYGLLQNAEIFEFLLCQWELGLDFDTNPAYPWAAAMLQDKPFHHMAERLEQACQTQVALNRLKGR